MKWILWGIVFAFCFFFLDSWFAATMLHYLFLQIPVFISLGWVSGSWCPSKPADSGASPIIFLIGSLVFWMIPRSMDLCFFSHGLRIIMRLDLLAAGFWLGSSFKSVRWEIKAAFCFFLIAMFLSSGFVFFQFKTLFCSVYTLEQQKTAGEFLVGFSLFWLLSLTAVGLLTLP